MRQRLRLPLASAGGTGWTQSCPLSAWALALHRARACHRLGGHRNTHWDVRDSRDSLQAGCDMHQRLQLTRLVLQPALQVGLLGLQFLDLPIGGHPLCLQGPALDLRCGEGLGVRGVLLLQLRAVGLQGPQLLQVAALLQHLKGRSLVPDSRWGAALGIRPRRILASQGQPLQRVQLLLRLGHLLGALAGSSLGLLQLLLQHLDGCF
mmetsp:Transcript_104893/g.180868  ORF Transcript_104893/g.180868 Transcript_104893/m.180868 type:complete len:207 (+) Transcript_104893:459-1079(+)